MTLDFQLIQIVASDLLGTYPLTYIQTAQDIDGDSDTGIILTLKDASLNTKGFAIYKVSDGLYLNSPQIIASDLFAAYPKTTIQTVKDIDGEFDLDAILTLKDGSNNIKGFASYALSDGFYLNSPQIIASDLFGAYPKTSIASARYINGNGDLFIILKLRNASDQIKGIAVYRYADGFNTNPPQIIASDLSSAYKLSTVNLIKNGTDGVGKDIIVMLQDNSDHTKGFALYTSSDGFYANPSQMIISDFPLTYSNTLQPTARYTNGGSHINVMFQLTDGSDNTKGVGIYIFSDKVHLKHTQVIASDLSAAYPKTLLSALPDIDEDGDIDIILSLRDGTNNTKGFAIYKSSDGVYLNTPQIIASDLSALYPLTGLATYDINSDGKPDLVLNLTDENYNTTGFAIYMCSDGFYSNSPQFITSDLFATYPLTSIDAIQDVDGDGKLDIVLALKDGDLNTVGFAIYMFSDGLYSHAPQIIASDLSALYPFTHIQAVQDINEDGKCEIILALTDTGGNTAGFAIYTFSDGLYSNTPLIIASDLSAAYPKTSIAAIQDINGDNAVDIILALTDSSDHTKGFAIFENTSTQQSQSIVPGVLNVQYLGSLLDFSLSLPPELSMTLSITSDVQAIFSDICTFAQMQDDNSFLAGIVINAYSDLFCSDALIVQHPEIVVVSCSDNVLHLNDDDGLFTFSITDFMSDTISMRYDDTSCHVSDVMSFSSGSFTLQTDTTHFIWIAPCDSDHPQAFMHAFSHPLLSIDAQGDIVDIGLIDCGGPIPDPISDLLFASQLKATALKFGQYLDDHFSDYTSHISDPCHIVYAGPITAGLLRVDLPARRLICSNFSISFSDVDICS